MWTVPYIQLPTVSGQYLIHIYLQYLYSTLCTVTGSIWTVPYLQLPALSGVYLMYIYWQYMNSTLFRVPALSGQYLK